MCKSFNEDTNGQKQSHTKLHAKIYCFSSKHTCLQNASQVINSQCHLCLSNAHGLFLHTVLHPDTSNWKNTREMNKNLNISRKIFFKLVINQLVKSLFSLSPLVLLHHKTCCQQTVLLAALTSPIMPWRIICLNRLAVQLTDPLSLSCWLSPSACLLTFSAPCWLYRCSSFLYSSCCLMQLHIMSFLL